jgi:hypothetical protein
MIKPPHLLTIRGGSLKKMAKKIVSKVASSKNA